VLALLFAASEPSKVPWFIAGGLLAVYAVVLAGIGLRRPDFPSSDRSARGVMALSLVLIMIAIAMAIITG